MSRILPVDPKQTDTTTARTLDAVKGKLGMLPNLFTTLARSPMALNAYLQLSEIVTGGRLNGQQRELIAIAVAQENTCEYCLSAHAAIGKGLGLEENNIELARRGSATDLIDDAIVAFSLSVVRSHGGVSDDALNAVRNEISDDGIIIEIVTNVVLNIMSNYVNRVAGTEVDFPSVNLGMTA